MELLVCPFQCPTPAFLPGSTLLFPITLLMNEMKAILFIGQLSLFRFCEVYFCQCGGAYPRSTFEIRVASIFARSILKMQVIEGIWLDGTHLISLWNCINVNAILLFSLNIHRMFEKV